MSVAAYHLLVIAVSVFGIVTGYRRGLLKQVSVLLSIGFGVVCARAFSTDVALQIADTVVKWTSGFNVRFVILTMGAVLVYGVVYGIVRLLTFPLGRLMRLIPAGMLNALGGAVLGALKYLIFVSLFYNLIVDINPNSDLLRVSNSHDGNVVEGVMKIAPALLGFPGPDEVGHALQLEEAKKIS